MNYYLVQQQQLLLLLPQPKLDKEYYSIYWFFEFFVEQLIHVFGEEFPMMMDYELKKI
jgi:hypothetical protein